MFKNRINAARSAIVAGAVALASGAHAALPEGAATAIEGYKDDALMAIGLVMAAGVAVWGLNKLATKLGWK